MNVSMIPTGVSPVIRCSQHDTSLRKWTFNLVSDGNVITPAGDASLICSNGAEITLAVDGDDLLCDCTEELSENAGSFLCKIKMVDGTEVIHSELIVLKVEVKP